MKKCVGVWGEVRGEVWGCEKVCWGVVEVWGSVLGCGEGEGRGVGKCEGRCRKVCWGVRKGERTCGEV